MSEGELRQEQRCTRGQATVEFVLVLPLVMLMLAAVVQVVVVARDRIVLAHAAQEAARSCSIDGEGATASGAARRVLPEATVTVTERGEFLDVEVRAPVHVVVPVFGRWFGGRHLVEHATARRQW